MATKTKSKKAKTPRVTKPEATYTVIDKDCRRSADEAADRIWSFAPWLQTREGYDYWFKIASRLDQIAEDGVIS